MDTTAKIKLLEERFQKLASSEKENYGVCNGGAAEPAEAGGLF